MGSPLLWLGLNALFEPIFLLAIFPTDTRTIRCLGVCFAFFNFFFSFRMPFLLYQMTSSSIDVFTLKTGPSWVAVTIAEVISNALCVFLQTPSIACYCCCPKLANSPRECLRRIWLSTRLYFAIVSVFWIEIGVHGVYLHSIGDPVARLRGLDGHVGVGLYGVTGVLFAVLATRRNRGRAQRLFLKMASRKAGTAEQEAAAVAALVGDVDPQHALRTAQERFRALPFRSIHFADLATNSNSAASSTNVLLPQGADEAKSDLPDAALPLSARTVRCQLGDCDVFFSHSWQDEAHCPGAKFDALSSWASEFEQAQGSTPLIWLDKACIDQDNIDASLACLPIFLSGCKQLLVAAGPTYSTRLWCVVEIFTFLKMGGTQNELVFLPIGGADVRRQLASFDAAKAQCFLRRDREKLLSVIESGFGDLYDFNETVKSFFPKAKEMPPQVGGVGVGSRIDASCACATTSRGANTETSNASAPFVSVVPLRPITTIEEGNEDDEEQMAR